MYGAPVDESRGGAGLCQRGEGPEGQLGGEQEQQEDDQHGRRGVVHILRTAQLKPDTRGIKRGKVWKTKTDFLEFSQIYGNGKLWDFLPFTRQNSKYGYEIFFLKIFRYLWIWKMLIFESLMCIKEVD